MYYAVNNNILTHTMHGMNTSDRFYNKQEELLKPWQVRIRK